MTVSIRWSVTLKIVSIGIQILRLRPLCDLKWFQVFQILDLVPDVIPVLRSRLADLGSSSTRLPSEMYKELSKCTPDDLNTSKLLSDIHLYPHAATLEERCSHNRHTIQLMAHPSRKPDKGST